MKELQVMKVVFAGKMAAHETPAFRGAVIAKVGLQRDAYHNHNNDPDSPIQYHYRYPLVQYRRDHRRPALVFIHEGIAEAQHLFAQPDWSLNFAGRQQQMHIVDMQVRSAPFGVTDDYRYYTLQRWQALNETNIKRYMASEDLSERLHVLKTILTGHVISFAKGINYQLERRFEVQITDVLRSRTYRYEGINALTFDVRIKTNLLFPPYVALGKGVSLGFGELRPWRPAPDSEITNQPNTSSL